MVNGGGDVNIYDSTWTNLVSYIVNTGNVVVKGGTFSVNSGTVTPQVISGEGGNFVVSGQPDYPLMIATGTAVLNPTAGGLTLGNTTNEDGYFENSVNTTWTNVTLNRGWIYLTNGKSLTTTNFTSTFSAGLPSSLKRMYSGGTINCSGTWDVEDTGPTAPFTFSVPGVATLNMTGTTQDFYSGQGVYPTVNKTASGSLTIYGQSSYRNINTSVAGVTLYFEQSLTSTITDNFGVNGSVGNLTLIRSTISGTQATLSKSSGTVTSNYLDLQDSNATGGAVWTANNSTFGSNVTGWLGNVVAFVKSRFMAFF
jgi:hypothetical protein